MKNKVILKVPIILKVLSNARKYDEGGNYIKIMLFSFFVVFSMAYFKRDIPIVSLLKSSSISFVLLFAGFSFFYFSLNESRKIQSLRKIIFAIQGFAEENLDLIYDVFLNRPSNFHPLVIGHPVAKFLLAHVLLHCGNKAEGDSLLSEAINENQTLSKIKLSPTLHLDNQDSKILVGLIEKDKKNARSQAIRNLWKVKIVRYIIIFIMCFIFFLHYFAQTIQLLK